jgi:LPXTG-motif cell wall-anchored protein
MKMFKTIATAFSLVALSMLFTPNARADEWNRETVVTISGPIEVPGVGQHILPAGTYVFKIFDSLSDRHIVQIFNQDKTHVFTTILAIPNYRLKATDKTVISFRERPAGEPEALRAWFYPGRNWGEEFVYAKPRAAQLAKETDAPVLATPIDFESAPIEALKTAPILAVAPTGEPVELAQVVEAPPAEADAAPVTMAAAALPKTASSLPLIGLVGLLGLAGSFLLSIRSKRTA